VQLQNYVQAVVHKELEADDADITVSFLNFCCLEKADLEFFQPADRIYTFVTSQLPRVPVDITAECPVHNNQQLGLIPNWVFPPFPQRFEFKKHYLKHNGKDFPTIVPDGADWVEVWCNWCKQGHLPP
jgi:hypothetical protein